jgi:hypothetical protein
VNRGVHRNAVQPGWLELPVIHGVEGSAREVSIRRLKHLQAFHQAVGADDAGEKDPLRSGPSGLAGAAVSSK